MLNGERMGISYFCYGVFKVLGLFEFSQLPVCYGNIAQKK